MGRRDQDTTATKIVAAYEAVVALGGDASLAAQTAAMKAEFERRTGAFHPEDPWFEARSRVFWDDTVASRAFAELVRPHLREAERTWLPKFERAHRGFFVVEEVDSAGARLSDLWSGAELLVGLLDEAQALAFEHTEGAMDARVVGSPEHASLYVLPGAFHHPADALEPAIAVLDAARARGMETGRVLDTLLKMELVFRTSSRVKAAFAYRVESLPRAPAAGTS